MEAMVDAGRHSRQMKAVVIAALYCSLALALPHVMTWLGVSEGARSLAITVVCYPLLLVMRTVTWIVDTLGPQGRPERASHYLDPWAAYSLIAVSVALCALFISVVVFSGLTWRERRAREQRSPAQR